jgi:hypothetical protein
MSSSKDIVDEFFSEYLGFPIGETQPGGLHIIASERRKRREVGYGPVFAVWMISTLDRCVVSVQDGLQDRIPGALRGWQVGQPPNDSLRHKLITLVSETTGEQVSVTTASGPIYYCEQPSLRLHQLHPCRAIRADDTEHLKEVGLDTSALTDSTREGSCWAAFSGELPVSLAYTAQIGHMADHVGDLAVETLDGYRMQGYAKTAVSHSTAFLLGRGKIPIYSTSDWNLASARTAATVGFLPYGWQLRVQVAHRGG